MSMQDAITLYLQTVAMALAAVWNGILAYEAWGKPWRVMASAATALLLIGYAIYKLTQWPLWS